MTLQLKIGSTSLPLPGFKQPYESEYLGFGTQFRTIDATLKTQNVGHKWRMRFFWNGLTASQKQTLLSTFGSLLSASDLLTLPDGEIIRVQTVLGSWSQRPYFEAFSNIPYYDVSFTFEQV